MMPLGELELLVMNHLWECGPGDTKAIHACIGKRRGIRPNTVQSTLKRLHEKGLLIRRKVSHAYVYSPASTKAEFHNAALQAVVDNVMDGQHGAMLQAFVSLTERAGIEELRRLEALVAERLEPDEAEKDES